MEGTPREARIYYRCAARSMVPGSAAWDGHPRNVYLPEAAVVSPLNAWIGGLFDRMNVDQTVAALVVSQGGGHKQPKGRQAMKKRLGEAEPRLRNSALRSRQASTQRHRLSHQRGASSACRRVRCVGG